MYTSVALKILCFVISPRAQKRDLKIWIKVPLQTRGRIHSNDKKWLAALTRNLIQQNLI